MLNAKDAIDEAGTIHIGVANVPAGDIADFPVDAERTDYVRLTVADNGRGMTPEVSGTRVRAVLHDEAGGQGTGLGLSTVYGTAHQNGGFVTVRSSPGSGSMFAFYLPAHRAAKRPSTPPPVESHAESATILVVDDEPMILSLISRFLDSLGYEVLTATGPVEAERIASTRDDIRLLISNVVMPGGSGPALAQRLKTRQPKLEVLLMSGYAANSSSPATANHCSRSRSAWTSSRSAYGRCSACADPGATCVARPRGACGKHPGHASQRTARDRDRGVHTVRSVAVGDAVLLRQRRPAVPRRLPVRAAGDRQRGVHHHDARLGVWLVVGHVREGVHRHARDVGPLRRTRHAGVEPGDRDGLRRDAGALSRSSTLMATAGTGSINAANWPTTPQLDPASYFTLTIAAPSGCELDLASAALDVKSSGTGPSGAAIAGNEAAFGQTTPCRRRHPARLRCPS